MQTTESTTDGVATTVAGPTPGAIMTPAYVRAVGRVAYLWGDGSWTPPAAVRA